MIVVAVTMFAKPAHRDDVIRLAQGMIAPSRAEAGCITYNFFADTRDPGGFHFFEEWESHDALKAHAATAHFLSYTAAIASHLEKPSEVRVYDVAGMKLL